MNGHVSGRGWLVITATVVGALVIVFALITTFLALSGFVEVPVLSNFYHPPVPLRIVQTTQTLTPSQFQSILETRLRQSALATPQPPYQIEVREEELTAALRGGIGDALSDPAVRVSGLQVAVDPQMLELSGTFRRSIWRFDLRLRARPKVTAGMVTLEPIEIRVNAWTLPQALASQLMAIVLNRDLGAFRLSAGTAGVTAVRLAPSTVSIELNPPRS